MHIAESGQSTRFKGIVGESDAERMTVTRLGDLPPRRMKVGGIPRSEFRGTVALGVVAALFLATGQVLPAASSEKMFFTRADLVEALTGQVEFRRAYTRQLRLPQVPECDKWSCSEDVMYGQLYELTFSSERLSRKEDGRFTTDRTSRGQLLVALDLSKETEIAFEDAWRAEIASLSPAAFVLPQAGMGYLKGALSQSLLQQSARAAWVCSHLLEDSTCEVVDRNGSWSAGPAMSKFHGLRIVGAAADVLPEVFRTPTDVLVQERTEVRFRESSTLAGLRWDDRLAVVPEGATFTKRPLDGKLTGGIRDRVGRAYRGREGRFADVERSVLLPPASVELLGVPMWVGEWRFETTHETFGEAPTAKRSPPVTIALAVVPIADSLMDQPARTVLSVPSERLIASVVELFKQTAVLDPNLVEQAFSTPQLWPGSGDWLIVGCRDDGTARYGIAPFAGAADVTNAREACAAIRRELP